MTELYSIKDVAKIFGVQESRLRYWAQTGFVNPSVRKGGRMHYTFQDLIGLRAAKELLDAGLSMHQVRQNLESLRGLVPELVQPGSRIHICSDGVTIVVVDHGDSFHPESGQVIMDFTLDGLSHQIAESLALPTTEVPGQEIPADPDMEPAAQQDATEPAAQAATPAEHDTTALATAALAGSAPMRTMAARGRAAGPVLPYEHDDEELADSVVTANAPAKAAVGGSDAAVLAGDAALSIPQAIPQATEDEPTQSHAPASAYRAFLQGCEAEDRGDIITAETAYRRALALQPTLAAAHTNLGNLLYRRGDMASARRAYERALELEPNQPEARYNLGNVLEDIGETELAIAELRRVCWMHPDFADAHYNLGLMLARVGGLTQAQEHLERYIQLDDGSEWAERARSFLQAIA